MQVELKHEDLIVLVLAVHPPFNILSAYAHLGCSYLYGDQVVGWEWNEEELLKITDSDLWQLYQYCEK
jgi:hypothetical protein